MKRRGFALLLASLAGCASPAGERTPTPATGTPEITETPEKTGTEETAEITDSPKLFEDISVEYRSFNTAEYLKYRKKEGGTAKLHPKHDYFAQLTTSITNTSDSTIDWYSDSAVWIHYRGVDFRPILNFEQVERDRQWDIENLSGWNVLGIQGEPISQVIGPGETARFYPVFDLPEGEETLQWKFRGNVVAFDPIA